MPGGGVMSLRLVPVTLAEARRFVAEHHRHNEPPVGHRVSVGIADETGTLRGVGILGRPVARHSDDGRTAEVLRVATDGVPNGCSMLYGALRRAAWALGYDRLITYTLPDEGGASLRASGWTLDGHVDKPAWTHTAGSRSADRLTLFDAPKMPVGEKLRWVSGRRS